MGDLLPVVVFGPLAGVAADRADKLVQNMICQLLSSVVATAFALMLVFGWLDLASLLLLVTLQGTLVAVIQPGRLAMVQEMVPRDDLSAAMKDSHSSGSQLP